MIHETQLARTTGKGRGLNVPSVAFRLQRNISGTPAKNM